MIVINAEFYIIPEQKQQFLNEISPELIQSLENKKDVFECINFIRFR